MRTVKSHCNRCQGETNQDVLHSEKIEWEEPSDDENFAPVRGSNTYDTLKCRGCDAISFRIIYWIEGHYDEHGGSVLQFDLYPPAIYRKTPKWLSEFDSFL